MKWKVSNLRQHWGLFRHVKEELLNEIRLFHVFPICDGYMCSSLSAIFVTVPNEVYAIGQNRCKMLGCTGNAYPDPIEIFCLKGVNIQAIDTGLLHTLALTAEGSVYHWGLNVDLAYSEPLPTILPKKVEWMRTYKVLQIACGSYFNLALTNVYTVMYWGYYDITQKPLRRPISFLNEPSIVSLSSGLFFSAAIGSSGKVYTWTGPKREQWTCSTGFTTFKVTTNVVDVPLGRHTSKKERPLEPKCIPFPETAAHASPLKVVCTLRSLYILMDSGQAYVTGFVPKAFSLKNENAVSYPPQERTFADALLSVTCAGYPTHIYGSRWTDCLAVQCINPEHVFLFADNKESSTIVRSITEAFTDMPTPQMKASYFVDQDFDEPVYVTPRPSMNRELFASEFLSDMKFQLADNKLIPAHRYVLLAYSQHFRNMFAGCWKETQSDVIDVSKYNPSAFKAYLNYIYNGVLDQLDVLDYLEVYHLADEHMENALKKLCLKSILKSNIESSTVAELYDWAMCNELKDFAKKCVEYGALHLQDVLKSDGFAQLASERREVFIKELFNVDRSSTSVVF